MGSPTTSTRLADLLRSSGWRVYVLPADIDARDSFFDAIRAQFPLDPPLTTNRSWDALSDSLFEGLSQLADNRIAIIWPRLPAETDDMTIALSILDDVRHLLSNENKKSLLVILAPPRD
jgi:hypothetical protein